MPKPDYSIEDDYIGSCKHRYIIERFPEIKCTLYICDQCGYMTENKSKVIGKMRRKGSE
jgi:hypothetical protein